MHYSVAWKQCFFHITGFGQVMDWAGHGLGRSWIGQVMETWQVLEFEMKNWEGSVIPKFR